MFGIGMPEFILIMVIALIVIGPKKLPELARAIGKGLSEFRKATEEIKESLNMDEIHDVRDDLVDSISGLEKPLEPSITPYAAPSFDDVEPKIEDSSDQTEAALEKDIEELKKGENRDG